MKHRKLVWMTLAMSLLQSSCIIFSPPFKPSDHSEHPFVFDIYYDGRCEVRVNLPDGEWMEAEGKLRKGWLVMRSGKRYSGAADRSSEYFCKLNEKHIVDSDYLMRSIVVNVYFDRFVNEIDDLVTPDILRIPDHEPGNALQLRDKAIKLQLSRYTRFLRKESLVYFAHKELPFDFFATAFGVRASHRFKRPWHASFSCSKNTADFHSKDGVVVFNAANDYVPDGLYMTMKGNLAIGGAACF